MAKFYVSCTTVDLEQCRKSVCTMLKRGGHEVVSMEDYTAEGRPSLAKCREDVERSDYYIGIFAWRYGWVPPDATAPADNAEARAVTELEYRHAKDCGKECLIFLLDEKAMWRGDFHDEPKTQIRALRKMLSDENMPSLFTSEEDLRVKVSETLLKKLSIEARPSAAPAPALRAREVKHDVAIFCRASDAAFAQAVAVELQAAGMKMPPVSADLLPSVLPAEFEKLEVRSRETQSAVVVLSDAGAQELAANEAAVKMVMQTVEARTGKVVAFCRGATAVAAMSRCPRVQVLDASVWRESGDNSKAVFLLVQTIRNGIAASALPVIGLPVIIFAMTREEAAALDQVPNRIADEVGAKAFDQFTALRQSYETMVAAIAADRGPAVSLPSWTERYDLERAYWKPFAGRYYTAAKLMVDVAGELNQRPAKLESRQIKVQLYPFDVLLDDAHPLRSAYESVMRGGCVVLADEFSIFHPDLRPTFSALALRKGQIALVTISPLNPRLAMPHQGLEEELKRSLKSVFQRFVQCDTQSEVMVADELRLKRWLHVSLPQTLRAIQSPAADPDRVESMWQDVGIAAPTRSTAARQTEARLL